ncbi:MAG: hypothetical protein C3F17_18855 [Bradyrhizobiaceae bacterium]|nr:MAG: hypothetical protein C3F17_18855 [Bradyrhizobiaceae bacterium]
MSATPPRRRPGEAPPTAPDDVSITGSRRSRPSSVDGRTPDPGKEPGVALETYEERVDRAVVESTLEHPEGSAPALERAVESRRDEKK